jgi:hypothetical protein
VHTSSRSLHTEMPGTRLEDLAVLMMCVTVIASYLLLSAAGQSALVFSSRFEKVPLTHLGNRAIGDREYARVSHKKNCIIISVGIVQQSV